MERWYKQKSNRTAKDFKLNIFNSQRSFKIDKALIRRCVVFLISNEKINCDELNIYFVGVKKMSSLHAHFFKDASITDCISINIDDPKKAVDYCHLGEIFICPKAAFDYISYYGGDFIEETVLYVVHGFLHLIGYDDKTITERKKMRKKEQKCIKLLKSKGLL
jgi:probable rRNA maturation factor